MAFNFVYLLRDSASSEQTELGSFIIVYVICEIGLAIVVKLLLRYEG